MLLLHLPNLTGNRLRAIFDDAINENTSHQHALEALRDTFLNEKTDREAISDIDIFFRHCMQFTGPLMAKGSGGYCILFI